MCTCLGLSFPCHMPTADWPVSRVWPSPAPPVWQLTPDERLQWGVGRDHGLLEK